MTTDNERRVRVETQNDFLFGYNGDSIRQTLPVVIRTREQAYRTAAWLVAMSFALPTETDDPPTFKEVLEAINNT